MNTPKLIDYQIIEAGSPGLLGEKVVDLIAQGWLPLGGVAVLAQSFDYDHATGRLYQAMGLSVTGE